MTTRTVLIAPGTAEATSATITVEADEVVTVGLYSAEPANLGAGVQFQVRRLTAGAPATVAWLTSARRAQQLYGPAQYVIHRPDYSHTDNPPFGADLEVTDA